MRDQPKIKQVLVNLFSNAIKFTNRGKISLKFLQINTGIDIAIENIEDIFERFTQASNGTLVVSLIYRFNLTISQQLIQKIGGPDRS